MNLDRLVSEHADPATEAKVESANQLVRQEVSDFVALRRAAAVTPTVVALRSLGNNVLELEHQRLRQRLPGLEDAQYEEIRQSMRRVIEKLLHQPTVNVKKAAASSTDYDYARALRDLFALDQALVDAVREP